MMIFKTMERKAQIDRKTRETNIHLELNLDGTGVSNIATGIPFMDHMLSLMAAHGFMDMELSAEGDIEVDNHHTVEDLGICLGSAFKDALGEKKGIMRYGEASIPMDEALARVVIDISNRPMLSYRVPLKKRTTGTFDVGLIKEFFYALVTNAGITTHIDLISGEDPHHISEAIFKAFARSMDQATAVEDRIADRVPSTKGLL
jgi:imidazoleglycerol-phosphate dehydratase